MSMEISDAARAAVNEYMREWRKRNKDKAKAAKIRYWEKKAKEAAAAEESDSDANEE